MLLYCMEKETNICAARFDYFVKYSKAVEQPIS